MHWNLVQNEMDTAQLLRKDKQLLTSPRYDDLSERAQKQVDVILAAMRGLVKAGAVGEGTVRVNASGYAHHDPIRMPADEKDFIAFNIGRVK